MGLSIEIVEDNFQRYRAINNEDGATRLEREQLIGSKIIKKYILCFSYFGSIF